MKIKLCKHLQESKENPLGEMRYYLIHLNGYQDFDVAKSVLITDLEVKLIDEIEWVWLRVGTFDKEGYQFIMYWDEDLGILFVTADHSEKESAWLEKLIDEAIPLIETRMSAK